MGLFKKLFARSNQNKSSKQPNEENTTNKFSFNLKYKDLSWFSSEDGLETYKLYITFQNYILQETIKKRKESADPDNYVSFALYVSAYHKDAKLPYVFFDSLVSNLNAETLLEDYVREDVVNLLCLQSKPFYYDDDGEPQTKELILTPSEIVSIEKNPVLNFISNFDCFVLADDETGSWEDKFKLYNSVLFFLGYESGVDKEVISKNQWIFDSSTYLNDLGQVRKLKSFLKKAVELSSDKAFFEMRLNNLDDKAIK